MNPEKSEPSEPKVSKEIRLLETEGFGKDIKRYDVLDDQGIKIGEIETATNARSKVVELPNVFLEQKVQGKGLGQKLYEMIGDQSAERGLQFRSSKNLSEAAKRVWEKLVEKRKATKATGGYLFRSQKKGEEGAKADET